MAQVVVLAIRNRTGEAIRFPRPGGSGAVVDIADGETLEGPFVIEYDEESHGVIPSPNEIWFVESPDVFKWATVVGWVSPDTP